MLLWWLRVNAVKEHATYDFYSPSHFLRTFPALNADKVQAMTLALLAKLPDDVYADIVSHAM